MDHSFTSPYFKRIFLLAGIILSLTFCASAQTKTKPAAKKAAKAAVTVKTTDTATHTKATASKKSPAAPPKTLTQIMETFFKKYKDTTNAAIDYIFATNKYFTNEAGITTLKIKLDSLRITLGAYVGHELILQKNASASLVLYTYLVKHEIQPIRFTFMFYKPHNEWLLYRFKYDEAMDIELEEAGKISNKH